jgi:hypothetical protein
MEHAGTITEFVMKNDILELCVCVFEIGKKHSVPQLAPGTYTTFGEYSCAKLLSLLIAPARKYANAKINHAPLYFFLLPNTKGV